MSENFYTILTKIGKAKIANSQVTGNKVDISQMAVGDSNGTYYNPTDSAIALRNEVWRGNIGLVDIDPENDNWIVIETVIPANQGGFSVREVGIFDVTGDLIAIGKYPETYKPILDEGSAKDLYIRMIIEVSNAAAVTLKIDPAVTLASRKYVDEKTNKNATDIQAVDNKVNEHLADYANHGNLKNKLINGDFVINQRGATTKARPTGVYGYDRWKGHANGLEQVIESLPAGTYTLSWQGGGNGTFGGVTGVSPITATVTAGNRSVVVPSNATKVQLEEGAYATPFEHRLIGLELMLCQRYYEIFRYNGACYSQGGGNRVVGTRFTTTKRVTPTITISNVKNAESGSNVSGTTFIALLADSLGFTVLGFSEPSSVTIGARYEVNGYADAEL